MIVYREQKRIEGTRTLLDAIRNITDPVERQIEFGVLESAVADALSRECDGLHPVLDIFRRGLDEHLESLQLPETVETSVPEGFAYYALNPDSYAGAARDFVREMRPDQVVVIGIRSIGTTLSRLVAENTPAVRSLTVRPRGHPFNRKLVLSPELERELRTHAQAWFAVVDEGPGLSGSSFASVTAKLRELGVAEERIVLFPGWIPSGDRFKSDAARAEWPRYRKYCRNIFQPQQGAEDWSGGAWRSQLYSDESAYPAVQPHHERLKYRAGACLYKFAGFGRYGREKLSRAEALADAAFTSPIANLSNGFLAACWLEGRPVREADAELLDSMARYLAFLRSEFPGERPIPGAELQQMIEINTGRPAPAVPDSCTTAIDGRMLPHEWLLTPRGYRKTDALDHHNDHFFPGCQDIAWDLAGASIEFALHAESRDFLLDRYTRYSFDADARRRLPFYQVAYAAWRHGYCAFAADALGDSADAGRFRKLAAYYASLAKNG